MALVLADRVLETTTTTGSGTITLAGIEPGYQSFSAVGDGNQTYYTIAGDTQWEVGIGTYTASGTTLSRDTVLSSSDSGNKVTFSAGTKKVFVTYPSEKSVNFGISGNITALSGVITDVADPVVGSDAANKLYVDTLAAQGISYHTPVKYEVPNTTGNLTVTYNNGSSGVGATLTNAGSLVPFIPDGVTASISDRVLIYNQTSAFQNGVYTVTTVGDGSTAWVLTRATDADSYGVKSPTELGGGDAFYVTSGNTGAGETYVCNNPSVIIFGSTAITFAQISAAQVYSAGTGISLTNTVISLVSPVAVATGGTGLTTSPTNGQLLIGNGSGYTLSTLTAGSGVSITNSAGSITLSTTNSGAVTSVTASGPLASSGGTTPNISIANSTGTGSVVLDQGATISSATITAAVSASITTITGTSANITTVSGTTARFSSGAITQLSGTSAGITTVSGTTTTFSSGTITQFGATSATIGTVSGTNLTYTNGNLTSATVTTASGTNLSYGSATITTGNLNFSGTGQRITGDMSNATLTSRLMIQTSTPNDATQLRLIPNGTAVSTAIQVCNNSDPTNSAAGAFAADTNSVRIVSQINGTGTYVPMAFLTGGVERMRIEVSGNIGILKTTPTTAFDVSGTITGTALSGTTITGTSGTITNLSVSSLTVSSLSLTNATFTSATITTLKSTSATIDNLASTSANITTLTGTTFGTTATTQIRGASGAITTLTGTSADITTITGTTIGTTASATIRGISGQITTLTATSANITTITGTTLGTFTSGTVTNLNSTSANITTLTGTTFGTTATTQLRGASGAITTLTGTSANITTINGTSADITTITGTTIGTTASATIRGISGAITTISGTTATYTSATVTNLALTSLTLANLSIGSANVTTLTSASGTITNLLATTLYISGAAGIGTTSPDGPLQVSFANAETSQFNGGAAIAYLTNTNTTDNNWAQIWWTDSDGGPAAATFGAQYTDHVNNYAALSFATRGTTGLAERMRLDSSGNLGIKKTPTTALDVSGTITGTAGSFTDASITSATVTNLASTSANITTLTGTTFGTTATTQLRGASAQITTATVTSANITTLTGTTLGTFTSGTVTNLSSTSANITTLTGTTFSDGAGNVRNIPSAGADKTSVYTLAITDIGEYVSIGTGGGIDVPNGIFSTGNAVSIYNNTTGARTISLTITTAYIAGTDSDKASVSLATRGLATILFISNSVCVITGNVT